MPEPLHFDAAYRERVALRDGAAVWLRMVRPSDRALLAEGFSRLSDRSRYQRFLAAKRRLSERELEYLTEVDGVRHIAIGAARDDEGNEGAPLGVGRYVVVDADGRVAEPAVTVVDDVQGKGLGSILLQRLVAAARERGVRRFTCDVIGTNRAAIEMLRNVAGADDMDLTIGGGVAHVEFDLPGLEPEHPVHEPPRASPMYRFFATIAEQLARAFAGDRDGDDDRDGDGSTAQTSAS